MSFSRRRKQAQAKMKLEMSDSMQKWITVLKKEKIDFNLFYKFIILSPAMPGFFFWSKQKIWGIIGSVLKPGDKHKKPLYINKCHSGKYLWKLPSLALLIDHLRFIPQDHSMMTACDYLSDWTINL